MHKRKIWVIKAFLRGAWGVLERVGRKIEAPEEDRDSTERSTESINLNPWEFPKTKPPTQEHSWAGARPPAHM